MKIIAIRIIILLCVLVGGLLAIYYAPTLWDHGTNGTTFVAAGPDSSGDNSSSSGDPIREKLPEGEIGPAETLDFVPMSGEIEENEAPASIEMSYPSSQPHAFLSMLPSFRSKDPSAEETNQPDIEDVTRGQNMDDATNYQQMPQQLPTDPMVRPVSDMQAPGDDGVITSTVDPNYQPLPESTQPLPGTSVSMPQPLPDTTSNSTPAAAPVSSTMPTANPNATNVATANAYPANAPADSPYSSNNINYNQQNPPATQPDAQPQGAYTQQNMPPQAYNTPEGTLVQQATAANQPGSNVNNSNALYGQAYQYQQQLNATAQNTAPTTSYDTDNVSATTTAAVTAAPFGIVGNGVPGARQYEGIQTPQLELTKVAPEEIRIGEPAKFSIVVKNTGQIAAHNIEIVDTIPKGTRLIDTFPRAVQKPDLSLAWIIETLRPNEEATVAMELMPLEEGEIGSQATVRFTAHASARTRSTRPLLEIRSTIPTRVHIGEQVTIRIDVSNPGTGTATGVVLEEFVPNGMKHPAGTELEYEVGDLRPGETKQLALTLECDKPGMMVNTLKAKANANLHASDEKQIEVIAPSLDIAVDGAKRRFLEREAVYHFAVSNPGTAPAEMVELIASLPAEMRFESANNQGFYDEPTHSVHWRIKELGVGEQGVVELRALPVETGQSVIKIAGSDKTGLTAALEHPVLVDGIPAVTFKVADSQDPVDVGGETVYEIVVGNQGTKEATNVKVTALVPPELRVIAVEGPTKYRVDATGIAFEPLPRLAAKTETSYKVRVQGIKPGDIRMRIEVQTDDMQIPVTKEESTKVYAD